MIASKNNLFKRLTYWLIVLVIVKLPFGGLMAQSFTAIRTIVIDAGHGGKDPGAVGLNGTRESHVALSVALKFGAMVEKNYPETKVIYTRKTDRFLTLNERADIANKAKADLFFSIHINASENRAAYGSSTYCLGLHKTEENLAVAKRENAVIELEEGGISNYDFDPNTPEGHIIMSMKQNAFLDQSLKIAAKIEEEQIAVGGRKSRGVKQAGFYVLYKSSMPAILTELGFISNLEEEQYMRTERAQELYAISLFKAFNRYKNELEGTKRVVQIDYSKAEMEAAPEPKEVKIASQSPTSGNKVETKEPQKAIEPKAEKATNLDAARENLPNDNTEALFRVQFMADKTYPKNKEMIEKKYGEIITEKLPNGLIRFMVGDFGKVSDAKSAIESLKSLGYKEAFLVAYESGQRVTSIRLKELVAR